MEPKADGSTEPETGARVDELASAGAGRLRPGRTLVASLGVMALVAATVGFVVATRDDSAPAPLVLRPNAASPVKEAPAIADRGLASAYRYRLAIAPPDLGSDAPVARLETPEIDAGRVGAMAAGLGIDGSATRTPSGGWQVSEGAARLTIEPTPGGWDVSYAADALGTSPGAVPGSSGAGAGTATAGPPSGPVASPNSIVLTPTTVPAPPVHLPSTGQAERIARTLLERLGVVDGSWSATVEAANAADSVTCTPEPCALPLFRTTTRTVVLHPVFNSIAIDGISWQVVLGDNAEVVSVSGTWATMRTLGRYPLRTVAAVFADLVAGKGTSPFPVPMSAIEPGGAAPDHVIQPIEVAIDRVALGYAVVPASDAGRAVVDVVPTYAFGGSANGAGDITQVLIAVKATVVTPLSGPNIDPGSTPPIGKPTPQPAPAEPPTAAPLQPTVSGTPRP